MENASLLFSFHLQIHQYSRMEYLQISISAWREGGIVKAAYINLFLIYIGASLLSFICLLAFNPSAHPILNSIRAV